ncbi:CsbD family protein [Hymenobacter sp. HMF4947]|uniref:CsbD family protein n=1 Tax=Hymenobacter ginkgonis TaxID=2682976 RepID=A0A7K1TH91_9BACT|nr:CsbD family protein [Hymenobacter ginkgonis]MVN77769.1 CsbD family protein [Hymenobacter ginkgonis]
MAYREEDNNSGKIILAALAGASAGIIAGILLAPDKGSTTLENWKGAAKTYGGQLGEQFNKYSADLETKFKGLSEKLEDLGVLGAGGSLNIKGNWDDIKGKLKQQYAQLTDEDLTYAEGKGEELLGKLQDKLGKGKAEVTKIINDLVGKGDDVADKADDAIDKGADAAKNAVNKGADAAKDAAK